MDDVYDKLRRLVTELREYGGMEAQEIAAEIGLAATNLSRFMTRDQATMSYELGASIEKLHAQHATEIRLRKIEKVRQLLTDLGHPPIDFGP